MDVATTSRPRGLSLQRNLQDSKDKTYLSPVHANRPVLLDSSISFDADDAVNIQEALKSVVNVNANLSLLRRLSIIDEASRKPLFWQALWFRIMVAICCTASVVSVCMNTPETFCKYKNLLYITFGIDIVVALVLSLEMGLKMAEKGIWRARKSYFRSFGRIFEFVMIYFMWQSIAFHIAQILGKIHPLETPGAYLAASILRSPRPMLFFRVFKKLFHLGLPSISKRPLRQILGVLLFSMYFMTFAAVIGVQMFGPLRYYCVKNGVDNTENLTSTDLLIPTTRCTVGNGSGGYTCPDKNFTCKELKFKHFQQDRTYFKDIVIGLFTIYEASTQEGWTFVLYTAMDSKYFLFGVVFFILVIFFIAWLVKNVFIAIVTEAFADLRSQLHSIYAAAARRRRAQTTRVFETVDSKVQLRDVDKSKGFPTWRRFLQKIVKSQLFVWPIVLCILADSLLQGMLPIERRKYSQLAFTIVFDLEFLLKLLAFGPRFCLTSVPMKFEFLLCVGSTASLYPLWLEQEGYALFQVMRPFRYILVWPVLSSFLKRILGSGKKLGSLIVFTASILVVASGIGLQLFCTIGFDGKCQAENRQQAELFQTFPKALQAMFQVLMQEAWNEMLHETLQTLTDRQKNLQWIIYPYFVLFHSLAAVILLSVFVALILDNLELDEELKLVKQRKMGELGSDTQTNLPARLKVFERFPANPKIIRGENIDGSLPKIRESFMRKYLHDDDDDEQTKVDSLTTSDGSDSLSATEGKIESLGINLISVAKQEPVSFLSKAIRKQSSVTSLIKESHSRKVSMTSTHSSEPVTSAKRDSLTGSVYRRRGSREVSVRKRDYQNVNQVPNNKKADIALARKLGAENTVNGTARTMPVSGSKQRAAKEIDVGLVRKKIVEAQRKKELRVENLRENYPKFDQSLFFLSYKSKIRRALQKITHARYNAFSDNTERQRFFGAFSINRLKIYFGSQAYLDWFMMLLTHLSCWTMMLEEPTRRTFCYDVTKYVEYIFVVTTSIELALKILADGLFLTPNAFIKDFGGALHVFIYIVSLVYVIWRPDDIPQFSAAQFLLLLRALRPLRIITLAPPLRKVVHILVRGYRDILKVAFLQLLLMFVFANYGVQMFQHRLKQCNGSNKNETECQGICKVSLASPKHVHKLKDDDNPVWLLVPCVWRNPKTFDFDNLGNAFLALFEVLSLEGWTEVRDILDKKIGWYASVYLHIYVFCACLIGLSLFIGIVVSNFNENKGTALLTVDQRRWVDLKKRLKLSQPLHMPPRPQEEGMSVLLYDLLLGKWYRRLYIFVVVLNCATLMYTTWEKSPESVIGHTVMTAIAVLFCWIYVVDFGIKVKAYGLNGYWLSWRNRFDCFLTILGLIWSIAQCISYQYTEAQEVTLPIGVTIIVFRFLSLSGKLNTLRMLVLTVVMSLFKSFYTISVLVVLMMCYALVGVILFGSVRHGLYLNRHANFSTSWKAMLLLFRITTGEDWNKIMHDCMVEKPRCHGPDGVDFWKTDCGNKTAAIVFFSSYYLLITYIFLNLFIAVVIENFTLFSSTDEDMFLTEADIRQYQEIWNVVDKERTGKVSVGKAKVAVGLLILRLGMDTSIDSFLYKRMCREIEKVSSGKEVTFHDLLLVVALNYKSAAVNRSLQLEERLEREEQVRTVMEEVAAQTIRTWLIKVWKERMERKKQGRKFSKHSGMNWCKVIAKSNYSTRATCSPSMCYYSIDFVKTFKIQVALKEIFQCRSAPRPLLVRTWHVEQLLSEKTLSFRLYLIFQALKWTQNLILMALEQTNQNTVTKNRQKPRNVTLR